MSSTPSLASPRPRVVFYACAAVLLLLGALAGCSRSSLQGELGLPDSTSCANGETCPAGTTCDPTSETCVVIDGGPGCQKNTNTDPFNCGACGNACPLNDSCVNGVCTPPNVSCANTGCPGPSILCCANGCEDT